MVMASDMFKKLTAGVRFKSKAKKGDGGVVSVRSTISEKVSLA